jgi:hypothetical protein
MAGLECEIDRADIRRHIIARILPGLERMPASTSEGDRCDRVSVEGYRSLRRIREQALQAASEIAQQAGLSAPTIDVDRYERRRCDGDRAWTADLTIRLGHVTLPMREVVLAR